ncbi:Alpha/Beta hydrolase protein [Crepidotus variabilis]|uniref:Alpha/Beta hydrolase protein n=1 Tax=Crepidotus variabilis TaxID=179855 RepID=A0A9P6EE62_9AGAR|nr:Alpha/Beta hydrolase protein [Crepidotus variabilis]
MATAQVLEGEAEFQVPGVNITCKTWYKVIGDLKSHSRPLVALHGGPGVTSEYLEILTDITNPRSSALVVYDQIGNGRSTHLPEKIGDDSFWTEKLFLDELDNVLNHLGIQDNYDLLGHSWGGMLGARHAVQGPSGLKQLVLMSTPSDVPTLWTQAQQVWLSQLPQETQEILIQSELNGTTNSQEYQDAVAYYRSLHLCTIDPMPAAIAAGFEAINKDPTVYLTTFGPTFFNVTGSFKNWSILSEASAIRVPTLVTNGKVDEVAESVVQPFLKEIPTVKWVQFEHSSHMAHYEERERFMEVVGEFLGPGF